MGELLSIRLAVFRPPPARYCSSVGAGSPLPLFSSRLFLCLSSSPMYFPVLFLSRPPVIISICKLSSKMVLMSLPVLIVSTTVLQNTLGPCCLHPLIPPIVVLSSLFTPLKKSQSHKNRVIFLLRSPCVCDKLVSSFL